MESTLLITAFFAGFLGGLLPFCVLVWGQPTVYLDNCQPDTDGYMEDKEITD